MTIQIQYGDIKEIVEAASADALLHRVKQEAAARAPFLLRGVIKAMPDLTFAAEAVKKENEKSGRQDSPPNSAQAFLDWAIERGYVKILKQ